MTKCQQASTYMAPDSNPYQTWPSVSRASRIKLLKGVEPCKASGPDQVRCCMLKELHEELSPFFTALFRNSNESGNLPEVWKSSWVSPVFKKGTKCDMANYRPLSLTWVACKLLEHILCSHIRNHLETHYALSLYQYGFRKRLSCESQLLTTTHDLLSRLNHMDEVGILDFSKAFDVVPYQRLMQKLRLYGIEGRTSNWISIFC